MVIGQTTALPTSIFSTTKTLTTEIAAQMGNAMEGGEMEMRTLDHGTAVIRDLPVLHLPDPPCDSSETGERRKTVCGKGGKVNNGK